MGWGPDSRSPLSFCSDRVVPVADSSELKHEDTAPQPGVFVLCHFSKWDRVVEKLIMAPNTDGTSYWLAQSHQALICRTQASLPIWG